MSARCRRRGGLLAALPNTLLLCSLLIACRNDFSSFRFIEAQPTQPRDASTPEDAAPDAPAFAPYDTPVKDAAQQDATLVLTPKDAPPAASDAATPNDARVSDPLDANVPPGDAKMPPLDANVAPVDAKVPPSVPLDSGRPPPPIDSSRPMPDATDDSDAQVPTETLQCTAAWSTRPPAASTCRDCVCDACVSPILDCLNRGTSQDRALCTAVYACALQHKCHDWDCYCATSGCYVMTDQPGDGPCAEEIGAAAGGHDHVSAVHRANDPNQPLVKAVRAIGCSIGVPWGSVGGMMTGQCLPECGS